MKLKGRHAWYSRKSHLSSRGYSGTNVWYVRINGQRKLVTLLSERPNVCKWPDAVYLGVTDNDEVRASRATSVPVGE